VSPEELVTLLGGGLAGVLITLVHGAVVEHIRSRRKQSDSAEAKLDQLIKSADHLASKLRALGERDFKGLSSKDRDNDRYNLIEYLNVAFVVAEFWAQIEALKRSSVYWQLSRDKRGQQLQAFLRCLESRRVRIVSRAIQRGIGEMLLADNLRVCTFHEFVQRYDREEGFRQWLHPLLTTLDGTASGGRNVLKRSRQRMLQYGVVVHALVDTIDNEHHVGRNRPGLPNKLSDRTRRDLRNRVFRLYLPAVPSAKYLLQKR
jgi:hypothetical protein